MNYTTFLEFYVLDMGDKNWCYEDGTKHYHFGDIENCDGVIDIGACYGGFTLAASSRTKADIVAVEPVWDTVVAHNMKKNHISKCKVVSAAVSDKKEVVSIEWNGSTRVVETITMPEILALLPSAKKLFVKCDCEGGEWNLLPEHFKNVSRLEIEFHLLQHGSSTAKAVNPDLVKFLESEYYVFPHKEIMRDANGIARPFSLWKKSEYPEKKSAAGQGPLKI